jgi:hypothetical protein
MKIKITLIEDLLGTASNNPELHREFIASKSPDSASVEEEVASVGAEAVIEKSMTVFPREDGKPFLYDYQLKGFFKDACSSLARVPGMKSNKLKAFKKVIDGTIFVFPRKIMLALNGELGHCQRPLRAQTAQGERVALANSESAPAGTSFECEIKCLDENAEVIVREWLDYGALRGLGQWRNSGKGRFSWEEVK